MNTPAPAPTTEPSDARRIVSVNSRSGASSRIGAKLAFVAVVGAGVAVAAVYGANRWRASRKAAEAPAQQVVTREQAKPTAQPRSRTFAEDPPPPAEPPPEPAKIGAAKSQACADGSAGTVLRGADDKPLASPSGAPMRVCKDGRVVVPAIDANSAAPIGVVRTNQGGPKSGESAGGQPQGQRPSRFGGDVVVATGPAQAASGGANPNDPLNALSTALAVARAVGGQQPAAVGGVPTPSPAAGGTTPVAATGGTSGQPGGSIGSMLTPSQTPMVTASLLGDRNFILPKGNPIECGMSMRVISDVAGLASCTLTQDVYSDNGRVLLLERGSEATGEYAAAAAQGQRRLFVLWTRIKTPAGVIINLNSPASDALGTSGMDGFVDNHWWERLGSAFLLSMVQDAIAYEVAKSTPPGGTNVYQQTASTGNKMAEKVLDSTIGMKPTIYKNQGDRAAIYVARDLDFSSVYVLRAR